MCEIAKSQRRTYRDQDPPRILETANAGLTAECEAAGSDEKSNPSPNPDFFRNQQQQQQQQSRREEPPVSISGVEATRRRDSTSSPGRDNTSAGAVAETGAEILCKDNTSETASEATITTTRTKVPSSSSSSSSSSFYSPGAKKSPERVITNGVKREANSCEVLTNGREMAPVMGVPPPPPAPHMGPDGLILPRKPYNPCLISNNHKDLRRELLFNQKIGKNVLNQKSELQRALDKQRETAMRKEAERNREETYKDDPRTALQRALEQRAKQIQLTEQPQIVEAPNPLMTARAKLRTRTDSQ